MNYLFRGNKIGEKLNIFIVNIKNIIFCFDI